MSDTIHGEGLDGTIFAEVHRQYTAFCSKCTHQDISWADNKREAEAEFRRCGWRIEWGKWVCGYH